MRILEIVEPGCDGVFHHVEGLTRFLIKEGVEVAFAYSSIRGSDRLDLLVGKIKASGGITVDLGISNAPSLRDVGALLKLRFLVIRFRPDVIHAHSSKAGALSRLLPLLGVDCRVIYTPHAYYGLHKNNEFRTVFYNLIETTLGGFGYTIHVSQSEAMFASRKLLLPIVGQEVISNGVDYRRFCAAGELEKADLRARWGIPAEAIVIGTIGRYSTQKDPITLYAAMKAVLCEMENVWFFHVGKGELYQTISDEVSRWSNSERIVRLEYLSDTSEAYKAMDLFVLSSRYEGLAISVLEAMATALPMVLTECPGNIDFANLGLNSVVWTESGNARALGKALLKCLNTNLGLNCNHSDIIRNNFDKDMIYGKIRALYGNLAPKLVN